MAAWVEHGLLITCDDADKDERGIRRGTGLAQPLIANATVRDSGNFALWPTFHLDGLVFEEHDPSPLRGVMEVPAMISMNVHRIIVGDSWCRTLDRDVGIAEMLRPKGSRFE